MGLAYKYTRECGAKEDWGRCGKLASHMWGPDYFCQNHALERMLIGAKLVCLPEMPESLKAVSGVQPKNHKG